MPPRILPFLFAALLARSTYFAVPGAHAAPDTTEQTLAAEVSRVTALVESLKADKISDTLGVPIRGEDLPKPADVPRSLWPDVGRNEYNWMNAEERNYRLTNASLAYSDVIGIGKKLFSLFAIGCCNLLPAAPTHPSFLSASTSASLFFFFLFFSFPVFVLCGIGKRRRVPHPRAPKISSLLSTRPPKKRATPLKKNETPASETPAFAADGTAYLPDSQGRLWRFLPPLAARGSTPGAGEIIARLPGRPLGIAVDDSAAAAVGGGRSLVVALAGAGLYRVSLPPPGPSSTAVVTQLTVYASADPAQFPLVPASASGRILYANGVLVSGSGAIYFTDSIAAPPAPPARSLGIQAFDTFSTSLGSLFSGDLGGRLCRHDPSTGETVVVSTGSWFSNGIAFSDSRAAATGNEDAIIMCETFSARLVLAPLRGPDAGRIQPFARSLPGYCDGVFGVPPSPAPPSSSSSSPTIAAAAAAAVVVDHFWVSINSKLTAAGATALASSPPLRWAASRVPQQVVELVAPPFGLVVRVDSGGRVAESLQDPTGVAVGRASSAVLSPDGRTLFTGSLTRPGLAYIRL